MRMIRAVMLVGAAVVAIGLVNPALARGQAIPVPSNPVAFCGTQGTPPATAYQLTFNGGAFEPVTLTPATTPSPETDYCQTNLPGFTHAFTLLAARFIVGGTYAIKVFPANEFGPNLTSPVFDLRVGIVPGDFTVGAVGVLPSTGERRRVP